MEMKKYIIAMSGGVDSSVAAHILQKEKYDIVGVSLFLTGIGEDYKEAKAVCNKIGIPFNLLNYEKEFSEVVIKDFINEYENGRTPNPCITCNRFIKINKLLEYADKIGYYGVATGHYARVDLDENSGRFVIKKALDTKKDQSYVLYRLTQEQLKRVKFPLGELTKEETRNIARSLGFANFDKKDSQDICFIPDGNYVEFIQNHSNKQFESGNIIDVSGNVIGRHKGAISYTLGQRKGLGLAAGRPLYVCEKNMKKNTVTVGEEKEILKRTVAVKGVNWVSINGTDKPIEVKVKLRYSQKEADAVLYPESEGVRLEFSQLQRAPAPGQAAVFYDGDVVIGGGVIEGSE